MVYTEGDTPMLVGLVSWSVDCGNPLYPGKLKCSLGALYHYFICNVFIIVVERVW